MTAARMQRLSEHLAQESVSLNSTHTVMGMYGGDSKKEMKINGTAPWIHMPPPLV